MNDILTNKTLEHLKSFLVSRGFEEKNINNIYMVESPMFMGYEEYEIHIILNDMAWSERMSTFVLSDSPSYLYERISLFLDKLYHRDDGLYMKKYHPKAYKNYLISLAKPLQGLPEDVVIEYASKGYNIPMFKGFLILNPHMEKLKTFLQFQGVDLDE